MYAINLISFRVTGAFINNLAEEEYNVGLILFVHYNDSTGKIN